MTERVKYAELTPKEFRERLKQMPVAYLPMGTLEWHGEHLPLGADGLQSEGLFVLLAQRIGGIVLPMLFVGPDEKITVDGRDYYGMDHLGFKGRKPEQLDGSAYWVEKDFYRELLRAILRNLGRAGFRVVVGHGHGPTMGVLRGLAEESREKLGLTLLTCWRQDEWDHADFRETGFMTDHAASNETSIMMALRPELVQMQNLPDDLGVWPKAIGGNDPRTHADREAGERIIRITLERMSKLVKDAVASES